MNREILFRGKRVDNGYCRICNIHDNPEKLYKSKKVAENVAEKLFNSCVNTGSSFEVVERIDENA